MTTDIHIAYDERAVDSAFASVFGTAAAARVAPKTTKTTCGKRVPFSRAQTHVEATCADCLASYRNQQAENKELFADMIAMWPKDQPLPDFLAAKARN